MKKRASVLVNSSYYLLNICLVLKSKGGGYKIREKKAKGSRGKERQKLEDSRMERKYNR